MKKISRRQFVKNSSVVMLGAMTAPSLPLINPKPLLSFSTLACPAWSFDEILSFAADHNYDGIEIRGLLKEIYLPNCPEFSSSKNIALAKRKLADRNLKVINLGSSATMHYTEAAERQKQIDEGKRFIDLAQQLDCPYVRVYPNRLPDDDSRSKIREFVINGLQKLGDYAKVSGIKVLMETHGNVLKTDELKLIMQAAAHPQVGLVWDATNMWVITKEDPAHMYKELKPYIYHTHIKDAKMVNNKPQYVFVGKGDTPILEVLNILYKDKYKGYYSFEWEKRWHPELAEPELALADYPVAIKKTLK